jgi:hypothetical protein
VGVLARVFQQCQQRLTYPHRIAEHGFAAQLQLELKACRLQQRLG